MGECLALGHWGTGHTLTPRTSGPRSGVWSGGALRKRVRPSCCAWRATRPSCLACTPPPPAPHNTPPHPPAAWAACVAGTSARDAGSALGSGCGRHGGCSAARGAQGDPQRKLGGAWDALAAARARAAHRWPPARQRSARPARPPSPQLPSLGVQQQFITFTSVTCESDKYICVRETAPNNQLVGGARWGPPPRRGLRCRAKAQSPPLARPAGRSR